MPYEAPELFGHVVSRDNYEYAVTTRRFYFEDVNSESDEVSVDNEILLGYLSELLAQDWQVVSSTPDGRFIVRKRTKGLHYSVDDVEVHVSNSLYDLCETVAHCAAEVGKRFDLAPTAALFRVMHTLVAAYETTGRKGLGEFGLHPNNTQMRAMAFTMGLHFSKRLSAPLQAIVRLAILKKELLNHAQRD